jgi:hypothetical protein
MKVTAKLKKEIRAEIERMFERKRLGIEVAEIEPKGDLWEPNMPTVYNQMLYTNDWDLRETTNLSHHKEWDDIGGETWIDLWIYEPLIFGRGDQSLIDNAYMTIKDGAITHASLDMVLGWQRSTAN